MTRRVARGRGWAVGLAVLGVGACAASLSCATGPGVPPPLPPPEVPAASAEPGESAPAFDDVFGVYAHTGGEADARARDAAIEVAVDGVFFLGRGFARDKLRVAAEIDDRIVLRRDGGVIAVELGKRFDLRAPLGGPGTAIVGTDGDDLELTFEQRGAQLIQLAKGERGGTRRVFTVIDDGALRVPVTIYATQLDEAVEYELTYRRVRPRDHVPR